MTFWMLCMTFVRMSPWFGFLQKIVLLLFVMPLITITLCPYIYKQNMSLDQCNACSTYIIRHHDLPILWSLGPRVIPLVDASVDVRCQWSLLRKTCSPLLVFIRAPFPTIQAGGLQSHHYRQLPWWRWVVEIAIPYAYSLRLNNIQSTIHVSSDRQKRILPRNAAEMQMNWDAPFHLYGWSLVVWSCTYHAQFWGIKHHVKA